MSAERHAPPHLLHVFPTFTTGGAQMRTVALINELGREFRHTVAGIDGDVTAREQLDPSADCRVVPAPQRVPGLRYAAAMRRWIAEIAPHLVLTYNWGAMDAFLAAATLRGLPVIHGEDGFGRDEAVRLLPRRVWTRRICLRWAHRVVVPSQTLLRVALEQYRLPARLVAYLPNGIDTRRFSPGRNPALRQELGIAADALVFGFMGRLGREKNLDLLLRSFAAASLPEARLVFVGKGECGAELRKLAAELGVANSVVFAGRTASPADFYRALDVFTMSSLTEQAPISLLEAMGCALPVLCTNAGDSSEMLGHPGAPAVVPQSDQAAYTGGLRRLAEDAPLRARLGEANRSRVVERFSLETMVENYRQLYRSALV